MYILSRRIYASNDVLVKMWAGAAFVILCVAAFLTWSDRFRETVETDIARVSVFGVEADGREAADFTGSRGFFSKMNKMGLPPGTREEELSALLDALRDDGALTPGEAAAGVPALWIYAEGKTKEIRDRAVQTFGKVFFDKSSVCCSVVADGSGFAVQLDPDTFRVLWAKDGGAICAIPLLQLPEDAGERGFVFRVEERGEDGEWKPRGDVKIPAFAFGAAEAEAELEEEDDDGAEAVPEEEDGAEEISGEAARDEITPESAEIESLSVPENCRFYSAPLWDRSAFGELRVRVRGNASGKVPAAAWSLENLELRAPGAQEFPMTRADAFHKNVRFLESEPFESVEGGVLRVPVAKTLFPADDGNGGTAPWTVRMRFARSVFFEEDFHAFPPMRVAKNDSVIAEPVSAKGSTANVRAFRDGNYFRALNNRPEAVVLEISNRAGDGEPPFSWQPFRVKTDAGEELFPESVVSVRPGVRRYCFLPRRKSPEKIEVVFAVTRVFVAECAAVPTVRREGEEPPRGGNAAGTVGADAEP